MSEASSNPFQGLYLAKENIRPILYQAATIREGFQDRVMEIAHSVIQACRCDGDAALASVLLDNTFPFTVSHSVHTAVVAALIALGRNEYADGELETLVCAALTMHISFPLPQDELANLTQPLNMLQKSSLQSHAKLSNKLLTEKKVKNRDWLNLVAQHHERPDGSGPSGMRGDAIHKLVPILSGADRFCFVTLKTLGFVATKDSDFYKTTIRNAKEEEDACLLVKDALGEFLPGTLVSLTNNEVAAILRHRKDNPQCPVIANLGKSGSLSLDQSTQQQIDGGNLAIRNALPLSVSCNRTKLCALWGYGAPTRPASASAA